MGILLLRSLASILKQILADAASDIIPNPQSNNCLLRVCLPYLLGPHSGSRGGGLEDQGARSHADPYFRMELPEEQSFIVRLPDAAP